jgi:hypothetical protein
MAISLWIRQTATYSLHATKRYKLVLLGLRFIFFCHLLEVCIDSAKEDSLPVKLSVVKKEAFCKSPVIGMVVCNNCSKGRRVSFESPFCQQRLLTFSRFLKVYVGETAAMVNEDGRGLVPLPIEVAFVLPL